MSDGVRVRGMTEEQVLINHIQEYLDSGMWQEVCYLNKSDLKVIIKALEQKSILDKIRAEIMQLDYDTETVDYDYNDMAHTEEVHTIYREEVLQIIDKYKAEVRKVNEKFKDI